MTDIAGQTALVTGGASGIGLLVGEILLQKGLSRLIVWDASEENILRATDRLGDRAQFQQIDVTDTAAIRAAVEHNSQAGAKIDILVNNAGIIVGKSFAEHTHDDIDRSMQVNTTAMMHLTRAILPGMIERKRGHVVNIASAAGMVSNPGMSVYCASKWAVIGWSDSLRLEMETARSGICVTTVTPYYIDTGMFRGVRSPVIPILKAEPTARKIVRAIERNQVFLRMPALIYLLPFLRGIMPARAFDAVIGRGFGIYKSMSRFEGRKT